MISLQLRTSLRSFGIIRHIKGLRADSYAWQVLVCNLLINKKFPVFLTLVFGGHFAIIESRDENSVCRFLFSLC